SQPEFDFVDDAAEAKPQARRATRTEPTATPAAAAATAAAAALPGDMTQAPVDSGSMSAEIAAPAPQPATTIAPAPAATPASTATPAPPATSTVDAPVSAPEIEAPAVESGPESRPSSVTIPEPAPAEPLVAEREAIPAAPA